MVRASPCDGMNRFIFAAAVCFPLALPARQFLDARQFGTYPDNLGHITSSGCFRCHDGGHTAKDGTTINADCESCHKQLEPGPSAIAQ
jgi:hypothetical protein